MEIPEPGPGEEILVMRLHAGITNRQIMDVFLTELARVLNDRGPDGTEGLPAAPAQRVEVPLGAVRES